MRYLIILIDRFGESNLYPNDEREYKKLLDQKAREYYTRCQEYITPTDKRLDRVTLSILQKIEV